MTEKIQRSAVALVGAALLSITLLFITALPAYGQSLNNSVECGTNIKLGDPGEGCIDDSKTTNEDQIENLIKTVINVLSAVVGSVSVIMIILGGFKYVTSGGDSNNVSGAKNTIMYAIVGLVIVAFAQIIVQFVLERT